MKRIIYTKGNYGEDEKWVLIKEYDGFGIYQRKCPTGYFVHQEYLITNSDITVIAYSFMNLCKDELLDAIDRFNETCMFGFKGFNRGDAYIIHRQGNMEV